MQKITKKIDKNLDKFGVVDDKGNPILASKKIIDKFGVVDDKGNPIKIKRKFK